MRDICSRVVTAFGSEWGFIGWSLFAGALLLPYFGLVSKSAAVGVIWGIDLILLLAWWVIDIADQQVEIWKITVGLLMLFIGVLPRAGILIIACWVIYMLRVRE